MRGILAVVIVMVTLLFGYCAYAQNEKNDEVQRQQFDLVMTEKIEQLYVQAKDWKTPLNFKVEDERLDGDYKVLSEFILKYWVDNIESRNMYLRELDQAKWDEFLNVRRLELDKKNKYQDTEKMFVQVKKIQSEYQTRDQQIYATALQALDALEMKADLREPMKEKLKFSRQHNNDQALFALELKITKKAEEMFEFLKNHDWQRRNEMILFKSDLSVNRFNELYRELNQLQREIDQLKNQNAEVIEAQTVNQSPSSEPAVQEKTQ